jgi:hypothetical protein
VVAAPAAPVIATKLVAPVTTMVAVNTTATPKPEVKTVLKSVPVAAKKQVAKK